jgi:lipid-A-disaccharide synthase
MNASLGRDWPRAGEGRLNVFIVSGEHSGDQLGAGLMRALAARVPGVVFSGVGGRAMIAEGLAPLFPVADISVMGLAPVLARLPLILRRIRETVAAALAARPDILIIIDSPDFTHRVARGVRKHMPTLPIVDYVSPTVWAWRPGRAKAMRPHVDHILALLPFEPAAHVRLGGPACSYVGHPLIERLDVLRPDAADMAARSKPNLLVLPGSRRAEIRLLSADFGETIGRVAERLGGLDVILPAVEHLVEEIRRQVVTWRVQPRIVTGEAAKWQAFRQARAALATSGTVTLELALAKVPMVVAYRVSPFETWLRYVITVPSIVLPNLVLGENVVPEFVQELSTPEALTAALAPLLGETPQRAAQLAAFDRLDGLMRLGPGETPSDRAAAIVLRCLAAPGNRQH